MDSDHNIAVLTGLLLLNYNIVATADMIFDHRVAFDQQRIRILMRHLVTNLQRLLWLLQNLQRLTGGNRAHHRNTLRPLVEQLDPTALAWLALNVAIPLQHREVIIYMTSTIDVHSMANLAVGRRHTIFVLILSNKVEYTQPNITGTFGCHPHLSCLS